MGRTFINAECSEVYAETSAIQSVFSGAYCASILRSQSLFSRSYRNITLVAEARSIVGLCASKRHVTCSSSVAMAPRVASSCDGSLLRQACRRVEESCYQFSLPQSAQKSIQYTRDANKPTYNRLFPPSINSAPEPEILNLPVSFTFC